MKLYHQRDTCRLCRSKDVETAVPLAPIPIATPNVHIPGEDRNTPVYREAVPLDLYLCKDCGLLQLLHIGNPKLQYGNYTYTTSLSLGLSDHFLEHATTIVSKQSLAKGSLVVEFGSNDGTLLRGFKELGMRVVGIDPANEIANRATASGIDTVAAFFSPSVAKDISKKHGKANILLANNVIANIDDMEQLIIGVRDLLAPDGVFIFETQYGADVIEHMLLDTIYHEHLSYFNVAPLSNFFEKQQMQIIDVEPIRTKGGSIRVSVQHLGGAQNVAPTVGQMIAEEKQLGLYDLERYQRVSDDLTALRSHLNALIDEQHAAGRSVGAYGVSVGTTTLLAQLGLSQKIDILFDDDPTKKGYLSGPGYDIQVSGPEGVYEHNPGAIVLLAWRYAEPIIQKHQKYAGSQGAFILPLPKVSVC